MRILIDANLPRSISGLLESLGHEPIDVRDIGLGKAEDEEIARYARNNRLVLLTRDFDFADIRNYPPESFFGIVVLELPDDARAATVLAAARAFFSQADLVAKLPTRLAVVQLGRVRFRPA